MPHQFGRAYALTAAGRARSVQITPALEFERARAEITRTGCAELVARAERTRCAARVASLVFEACAGFEALWADAPAPEQADAEHLVARPPAEGAGARVEAERLRRRSGLVEGGH